VLLLNVLLTSLERDLVRLLHHLQVIVASGIIQHLRVVLVLAGFKFLLLLLLQELQLLFIILNEVPHLGVKLQQLVSGFHYLGGCFLFKIGDFVFLLVRAHLVVCTR